MHLLFVHHSVGKECYFTKGTYSYVTNGFHMGAMPGYDMKID